MVAAGVWMIGAIILWHESGTDTGVDLDLDFIFMFICLAMVVGNLIGLVV